MATEKTSKSKKVKSEEVSETKSSTLSQGDRVKFLIEKDPGHFSKVTGFYAHLNLSLHNAGIVVEVLNEKEANINWNGVFVKRELIANLRIVE